MSQLIALIIAIALGAIVTAIGFVFLGDAFTKNSERGVALQFVSQASQVEMALTAHRAEQAKSAVPSTAADATAHWTATSTALTNLNYLKDTISAPFGDYTLLRDVDGTSGKVKVLLVAQSPEISNNVCIEVERLKEKTATADSGELVANFTSAQAVTALDNDVYGCFNVGTTSNAFIYRIE